MTHDMTKSRVGGDQMTRVGGGLMTSAPLAGPCWAGVAR